MSRLKQSSEVSRIQTHRMMLKRATVPERLREHAELATEALIIARRFLQQSSQEVWDQNSQKTVWQLNRANFRMAIEALEKGIGLERLSYGLPSAITRVEHEIRTQVEMALNIQERALAVVSLHICPDCRRSVGEELMRLQDLIATTQEGLLQLGSPELDDGVVGTPLGEEVLR